MLVLAQILFSSPNTNGLLQCERAGCVTQLVLVLVNVLLVCRVGFVTQLVCLAYLCLCLVCACAACACECACECALLPAHYLCALLTGFEVPWHLPPAQRRGRGRRGRKIFGNRKEYEKKNNCLSQKGEEREWKEEDM